MKKKEYVKPTVIFYEIGNLADDPNMFFYSGTTTNSLVKQKYGIYDFDFDVSEE